ncbi:putative tail protein [Bacillus phage Novomoskovsk]|uniref:Putative tail protein n=1 Tax=Bacillus phage Novomoskovsk TaxID=2736258 RepID=A0A6M9Z5E7_9CAUD|nr:putative tail protein [Bacillus phage Novomoskovsk]
MAIKKFPIQWIGVYRADRNSYVGGNNIRVGGSADYQSYIGIPTAVRTAINTSRTSPKLRFVMNVTSGAEFDFGAHKETSNKASGKMPYYNYIGLHPIYGTGWRTTDLTSAFLPSYKNGSRQGIVIYGARNNSGQAYGKTGNSNEAYFEVEGTWNTPPTAPKITSPTSTTVATNSLQVKWNASSDPETATNKLKYQVQIFNGSTWSSTSTTGEGVTSYSYNTSNMAETSSAQVRVRAYDGEDYSAWSTSPKFSIVKNLPPSKPTQLVPNGGRTIDRTESIRFTWKHNDDGVQAGFRIAWRTVSSSGEAGTWNYVNASGYRQSTNQYFDFAPNTFPAGKIEWRVTTMDQESLTSPWSDIQVFTAGIPSNAPIILSPEQSEIIPTSNITVTWSSINQRRYEVQIYDGSTQVYRKAETTTVKNAPIDFSLENNKTYRIRLRIADTQFDIWSEWSEITIQTNFIPPIKPDLSIESDEEGNTIIVSWTNDPPATTEPINGVPTNGIVQNIQFSMNMNYTNNVDAGEIRTIYGTNAKVVAPSGITYEFTPETKQVSTGLEGTASTSTVDKAYLMFTGADPSRFSSTVNSDTFNFRVVKFEDNQWYYNDNSQTWKPFDLYTDDFIIGDLKRTSTAIEGIEELNITGDLSTPVTSRVELYRRRFNSTTEGDWTLIHTGETNSSYTDYTPASGVTYEYYARAWGDNQSFSDSEIEEARIDFIHAYIHRSLVQSDFIVLRMSDERSEDIGRTGRFMSFAGREKPIYEYGYNTDKTIDVKWEVDTNDEYLNTVAFLTRKETFLYRDALGRRMFCIIDGSISVDDNLLSGCTFGVSLREVDFEE